MSEKCAKTSLRRSQEPALKVPSLEMQRMNQSFKYEKIRLVMVGQTVYDKCLVESGSSEKPCLFSFDTFDNFEQKETDDQIEILQSLPQRLKDRLFTQFDLLTPSLGPHKCIDEEQNENDWECEGRTLIPAAPSSDYICRKATGATKCLRSDSETTSWICEKNEFKECFHTISNRCYRVLQQIKTLKAILNDSKKSEKAKQIVDECKSSLVFLI